MIYRGIGVALLASFAFGGCKQQTVSSLKDDTAITNGAGNGSGRSPGSPCVFSCSEWNPQEFGTSASSRMPPLIHAELVKGNSIGVAGTVNSAGICVPTDPMFPEAAAELNGLRQLPQAGGPVNDGEDSGVDQKSPSSSSTAAVGILRYECIANGVITSPSQVASGSLPGGTEDMQTYAEEQCILAGLCKRVDVNNKDALENADQSGPKWPQGGRSDALALNNADWDPNAHAPRGFLGRRIVAHITQGPCQAFRGVDRGISTLENRRWGIYAALSAAGGAGGALRFGAAQAYDLSADESAGYVDAGVNIGFNASLSVSVARGLVVSRAGQSSTIHNNFGGEYVGANAGLSTPFARVGVGGQISAGTPVPPGGPFGAELSLSFGISAGQPFEANVTAGRICPANLVSRRLRGVTQGWVNVFNDEYGSVAFGGIPNWCGQGNYERMRNSPNSSAIWKAGSMANSAVRFASAPDMAAFFLFRTALSYAWDAMRRICPGN